jgi:tetratricopeptide (TPR) repeat protein
VGFSDTIGRHGAGQRWRAALRFAAGAILLLVDAAATLAQQAQPPSSVIDPARQAPRRAGEIEDAARESEAQRLLRPDRIVTYEDVLANPDDVDINFAYAQIQIARGDVRSAGATLERILLINPDLPRVRLLYAIVLYRLDNIDEADRELRAVRLLEMPPSLRAELDRYLEQIALRRKRTRYTAVALLGFQYDWNRNAAAASGVNLISDLPGNLDGHSRRRQDQAIIGLTRFDATHDLGYQARHRLSGALTYYRGEQVHLSEIDLQAASAEIGGVYDASPVSIIPTVYGRRIMLANQFYSYNQGINLRAEHQLTGETQLFAFGEGERQKYRSIGESATAPDKTGPQFTLGGGANYTLSPEMRVGIEVSSIRKFAARNYQSYDGETMTLSHTWFLGDGMFLLSSLNGEIDRYEESDPSVSSMTRRDRIGRARMTFGLPVANLVDEEGTIPFLRDFTLLIIGEATRQVSNLTNYTYNNRRAGIGLSKRWEF